VGNGYIHHSGLDRITNVTSHLICMVRPLECLPKTTLADVLIAWVRSLCMWVESLQSEGKAYYTLHPPSIMSGAGTKTRCVQSQNNHTHTCREMFFAPYIFDPFHQSSIRTFPEESARVRTFIYLFCDGMNGGWIKIWYPGSAPLGELLTESISRINTEGGRAGGWSSGWELCSYGCVCMCVCLAVRYSLLKNEYFFIHEYREVLIW
jgi:hypothetical protein